MLTYWYRNQVVDVKMTEYAPLVEAKQGLRIKCGNNFRLDLTTLKPLGWGPLGPSSLTKNRPVTYIDMSGPGGEDEPVFSWTNLAVLKTAFPDDPGVVCPMVSACQCHELPCREGYLNYVDSEDIIVIDDWDAFQTSRLLIGEYFLRHPPVFAIVADWELAMAMEDPSPIESEVASVSNSENIPIMCCE